MAGRREWLDEGMSVLAELGTPGLRIDRLSARLGATKGSFYHHFDGMPGYQRELLAHLESQLTTRFIDEVERSGSIDARARLDLLMDLVLARDDTSIEVAVRAWASQDRHAEAAQRRTDATRVDYLRSLLEQLGHDGARALELARTLYLILIGSAHIVPPLSPPEIRRLWKVALQAAEHEVRPPGPPA
jgi:AcrR family transcriptional regulator